MKVYGILEVAQLEQLSADPTPAVRGRVYYNTSTSELRVYNGTAWIAYASTSASATNLPPTVTGSESSPTNIVAGTGIGNASSGEEFQFIKGTGGVVVSANPQVAVATTVGNRLTLMGTSDTDYVDLVDGTGLRLNGPWRGGIGSVLNLIWNGTLWRELSRV